MLKKKNHSKIVVIRFPILKLIIKSGNTVATNYENEVCHRFLHFRCCKISL